MFANTHATEDIEVFFKQADAVLGAGFGFTVSARTGLSMPLEASSIWVRSTNASTFSLLAAGRG
jgi:hypothetical protein